MRDKDFTKWKIKKNPKYLEYLKEKYANDKIIENSLEKMIAKSNEDRNNSPLCKIDGIDDLMLERLNSIGILDLLDFLLADPVELAKKLGIDESKIDLWLLEATDLYTI